MLFSIYVAKNLFSKDWSYIKFFLQYKDTAVLSFFEAWTRTYRDFFPLFVPRRYFIPARAFVPVSSEFTTVHRSRLFAWTFHERFRPFLTFQRSEKFRNGHETIKNIGRPDTFIVYMTNGLKMTWTLQKRILNLFF